MASASLTIVVLLLTTVPITAQQTPVKSERTQPQAEDSAASCQEALASEPIRNMDRHLNQVGIHYEKIFDGALGGASCTGEEIVKTLVQRGANLYDFDDYGSLQIHSLRYKPGPMNLKKFRRGFHVAIVADPEGRFEYSNWEVDL